MDMGASFDGRDQLQVWAEHCPENFENRAALVDAEIAARCIAGDYATAIKRLCSQ
jgi:hypothetical protein